MAIEKLSQKSFYVLGAVSLIVLVSYFYFQPAEKSEDKSRVVKQQTEKKPVEPVPAVSQDLMPVEKVLSSDSRQVKSVNQKDQQKVVLEIEIDKQDNLKDEQLLAEVDRDIAETESQPVLWEPLDDDEELEEIKISEKIEGAQKIKMNLDVLSRIVPGEKISLPELDGVQYNINIEKVFDDKKNVNIRGHIEAHGSSYLATITQGEKMTFATISTPTGTYDLRLVHGKGWVYGADQLNKHLDRTKSDELLPPKDLIDH